MPPFGNACCGDNLEKPAGLGASGYVDVRGRLC